MDVKVIRVDGTTEKHSVPNGDLTAVRELVGCDCFHIVTLRDGMVMMADIMPDGKPTNPEATKLYHGVCRPGTTHCIHGDVAIVRDADFA